MVEDLAVPIFIGMEYQDKYIKSTCYKARRLLSVNSCSIAVMDTLNKYVCTVKPEDDTKSKETLVFRRTGVLQMYEVPVRVSPSASGKLLLAQHEGAGRK